MSTRRGPPGSAPPRSASPVRTAVETPVNGAVEPVWHLRVEVIPGAEGVVVRETFDAEATPSIAQQRAGWQAILDNFARHVVARP